jgi:hypothetical protein
MWKSGGAKTASETPEVRAPKSRFRGPLRLLLIAAVLFIAVVFVFPLVFRPRVDVSANVQFGSPSSVTFQISNQNMTPMTDVEYTCEVSKLTRANGSAASDVKVVTRGAIRKIEGRSGVIGRCQTAYIVTGPVKTVEYQLTLHYRAYPWRKQRTGVYPIAARINGSGDVIGWKVE